MKLLRLGFLPVITAVLFLLLAGCSPGFTKSVYNKPAPQFELKDLDGRTVNSGEFQGQPILINFWASYCLPCRQEMTFLQQVYDDWKNRGLVFLTIDIGETPETIRVFFEENDLSLPVLLDTDGEVGRKFGITGIPETFIIDKNGIIQQIQIGPYPSKVSIENDINVIVR